MQMLVNGTIMMKMETIYALMGLKENIQSLPSRKGQIISECPYEIIVYPKIATKKFPRFLP